MIERLTPDEQHVLLELLIHIARADGKVEDVEREILENYASIVEVDFKSLKGTLTPAELLPRLTGATSRAIVLQEMLRLSHIDGVLSRGERDAIISIAGAMGFSEEVIHKLDQWVVDGLQWVWRGEDLLDAIEAEYGAAS